jgi:hypothetical protein
MHAKRNLHYPDLNGALPHTLREDLGNQICHSMGPLFVWRRQSTISSENGWLAIAKTCIRPSSWLARPMHGIAKVSQPFSLLKDDCLHQTNKGPVEWHIWRSKALPKRAREHIVQVKVAQVALRVLETRSRAPLGASRFHSVLACPASARRARVLQRTRRSSHWCCMPCTCGCNAPRTRCHPVGAHGHVAAVPCWHARGPGRHRLHRRDTHFEVLFRPPHTLECGALRHGFPAASARPRAAQT